MGRRGPGARKKSNNSPETRKLRKRLPWHKKGLSKADQVIAFAEFCPITSGSLAGENFALMEWQKDFLRAILREEGDVRPVRRAVLSLPRKCGKTALSAILCAAAMFGPLAESRGQVVSAANNRAQASLIFDELVALIVAVPEFDAVANIRRFHKEIEILDGVGSGTVFKALSADAKTAHGLSPTLSVYDEYGQSGSAVLYEALATASGARANALCLVISTEAASDDAPMSLLVDYGKKVMSGEVEDPSFHLEHYGAPLDADPWDPDTWRAAIPALGVFRSEADVANLARSAKAMPTEEGAFKNLVLNMRVAAHSRFLHGAEWDANGHDLRPLKGRLCYGGLDLSWGRDLTAFVLVFPDGDSFDVLAQFWLPSFGLKKKSAEDRVPWHTWAGDGYLSDGGHKTIDPVIIAKAVKDAATKYDLRSIGFDRWGSAQFKLAMDRVDCTTPLEEIGQGYVGMNGPVRLLERCVAEERLRHGMNPILRMNAANAVLDQDPAGNVKLNKAKSTGKIDGLVALAMALHVAESHKAPAVPAFISQFLPA